MAITAYQVIQYCFDNLGKHYTDDDEFISKCISSATSSKELRLKTNSTIFINQLNDYRIGWALYTKDNHIGIYIGNEECITVHNNTLIIQSLDLDQWECAFSMVGVSYSRDIIPIPKASTNVDITYSIMTKNHGILIPATTNRDGLTGFDDDEIIGILMTVSTGEIKYRVHTLGGKWQKFKTNTSWEDKDYAGDGIHAIDGIQIIYSDEVHKAIYQVKTRDMKHYGDNQINNNKSTYMQGYAGELGTPISHVLISIE